MNYLAHSLFYQTEGQLVGQFLNDYIPNRDRFSLPLEIQKGIKLHREIDTYTDAHPIISEAKKVFSPLVRLYSGAFVDVVMDYFLANDTNIKNETEWKNHTQEVYCILKNHLSFFPESFKIILSKMEEEDWLYNYRYDWGIRFSLQNVLHKAKYLDKNLPIYEVFLENKSYLQELYLQFFPDLQKHFSQLENKRLS